MPPEIDTLAPPATRAGEAPAIRGAVDNVGATKIYGWAWYPDQPTERLLVEVRLGAEVAVSSTADFARADLPGAGIGDGNHAFELKLTPECVARRAEMTVVARAADGTEAKLPFRVRRTPEVAAAQVQRNIEQLAANQRELREEMRAALAQVARGAGAGRSGAEASVMAAGQIASAQARLEERLATLDVWLTRLDARLAMMAEALPARRPARRIDAWQMVLGAVLGLAGGGALAVAALLLRGTAG